MSAKDAQTMKQLQGRKAKAVAAIEQLKSELHETRGKLADAEAALANIKCQINAMTGKEPVVTEHAIIRYLERAMGLDLNQITKEILPDDVAQMVKTLGNGKYPIGNGIKIVVRNSAVVSVV